VSQVEVTYVSPVPWVAEQLEMIAVEPGRRALVLVAAERQAHAVRRHLCVERSRPDLLAGVLFLRPADFARELLVRAGTLRASGWEEVRRLRILQLFESGALKGTLRYFDADQLRAGQGYVDAFARTIADLEASGLDAALALAVADRLPRHEETAAHRLHDVAATWQAADAAATTLATTAQMLAQATALVTAQPRLQTAFGPIFAVLTASPSAMLLRFLRALQDCRVIFQEARPLRTGTQRWRGLLGLQPAAPPPRPTQRVTPTTNGDAPGQLPLFGTKPPPREETSPSELSLVQRFLFQTPEMLTDAQRPRSHGPDGSVDVEEYPSIEEEIEAAATWVTEQIGAGIPAERIALVVPEIEPYAPLLADRLQRVVPNGEASGIATYVAGGLSLAALPAGMRVQALLDAVGRGLQAEPTIRVLPALRRNEQDTDAGRARLSLSRAAAIVHGAGIVGGSPGDRAGVSEWLPRLTRRRDTLRQLLAETAADDADEPEKRRHTINRQEAQRWLKDIEPILPAIGALQEFAESTLGGAPLHVVWQQLRAFCVRWMRIPPDPPTLFADLELRLQPVLNDPVATAVAGVAALHYLMDVLRRERRPSARFGEPCVFIGTPSHAAGLPFAAVRVLGLAEGGLPHTPHDDPIVPDGLRKRIEEVAHTLPGGAEVIVPRLADHVLDDIHDVFRVVSDAGQRLALSAPRQWVDRSEREVSGIMLEVATALGRSDDAEDEGDVPTAARLRAAYFNAGRAVRLRHTHDHPLSPRALLGGVLEWGAYAAQPGVVPAGWTQGAALAIDRLWELVTTLESPVLGGLDGAVSEVWSTVQPPGLVPQPPISASGVNRLLECPHRFLLERMLHFSEPATRPSTDVIEPAAYGSLFHAAADQFFREAGAALCRREGSVEQWVTRAREIATEQFEALRHEYPLRGADGTKRERDRLLRQIEQLVRYEWEQPPRDFLATELSFGDPEAVRLQLDTGELYVRGAIDRVDRIGPGALSVRDLKTGRVRDRGEDPINAGRDLQIGLYVLVLEAMGYAGGARAVRAAYVHPSAAREPERTFEGTDLEVLRRNTREWLDIARRLLSTGIFPRTPDAADCTYCPFVPACGDGAWQRSAAKLSGLAEGHPLQSFVRLKRKRGEDEA